jgi:hypothetical protein
MTPMNDATGEWNFDISLAPHGVFAELVRVIKGKEIVIRYHQPEKIIAADRSGTVVNVSYWVPRPLTQKEKDKGMTLEDRDHGDGRWCMYTKDVPPVAWRPWPKHPNFLIRAEAEPSAQQEDEA